MSVNSKSTSLVIFGASGDLTNRKLIPALYNAEIKGILPPIQIIGYARRPYDDESFRARLKEGVTEFSPRSFDESRWDEFAKKIHYFKGDLDQSQDFVSLKKWLIDLEPEGANRLYYLAISPTFYETTVQHLGAAQMADDAEGWRHIVVEKPFGRDLQSAQDLNKAIHEVFLEEQVYRIDHYLGKETAQNILYFRFANTIFEPIWNRRYIDHVQITVAETVDVSRRGAYYNSAGVLRDMFQNHLLQLFTLVAMEPPASFDADVLRNEKVKVLMSTRKVSLKDTVLAQYEGYLDTPNVARESRTPTYAAIKLYVDNWRWKNVPFYLRSGKALKRKTSEITVQFQRPPHLMFHLPKGQIHTPNYLSICIQPDEGIHLRFEAKEPGSDMSTRSVDMEFHYSDAFGEEPLPDAYERLLLDALDGDAALFARSDGIEAAWRLVDPVIHGWDDPSMGPLASYSPGEWGPDEGIALMARDRREWRSGCEH